MNEFGIGQGDEAMNRPRPIALVDLDGTLADYDAALQRDLAKIAHPNDPPYVYGHKSEHPDWLRARHTMIRNQKGWWQTLPRYEPGFALLGYIRSHGFEIHVLTKGPSHTPAAWTEKVEWCKEHVRGARVHITSDKSLVYGLVLMDDWPPYVEAWLEWRPRGLVLLPDQPWNQGAFDGDDRVLRCVDGFHPELHQRLREAIRREPGQTFASSGQVPRS